MKPNYSRVTDEEVKELFERVYTDMNPCIHAKQSGRDLALFILALIAVEMIGFFIVLKLIGVL